MNLNFGSNKFFITGLNINILGLILRHGGKNFDTVINKFHINPFRFSCSNYYKISVEELKWKSSMGKPKRRWKDNIQTYLKWSTERRRELDLTGSGCGPGTICCENGDGTRFHKKVKGKLVLVQAIKVYSIMEVYIHSIFSSVLDGGEYLASRTGCFTSEFGPPLPIQ